MRFLESKRLDIILPPTVIREVPKTIGRVIKDVFDEALGKGYWAARRDYNRICRERFDELCDCARKPQLRKVNLRRVRSFYQDMLNSPETKEKLERLKQKKQRGRLLPEESDMKILAEAIALLGDYNEIYLIHRDSDYGWFSDEIEGAFGLKPISVEDLNELRKVLTSGCRAACRGYVDS